MGETTAKELWYAPKFIKRYRADQVPAYDEIESYGELLHTLYDPPNSERMDSPQYTAEHFPFIIRRVETMKLYRLKGDKREISLDIDSRTLCDTFTRVHLPKGDKNQKDWLIPIAVFRKQILLNFDSRDSRRNLNLAARCVSYVAGYAWLLYTLQPEMRDKLLSDDGIVVRYKLWAICERDSNPSSGEGDKISWDSVWNEIPVAANDGAGSKARKLWNELLGIPSFKRRLTLLYDNYFPFVVVHKRDFKDHERHMIKFAVTYGQPAELWANAEEHRYRGKPLADSLEQYGVLEAHSEHLRLICPPGIEFADRPTLYLPYDTPQSEVKRLKGHPPTYVFHRRTIAIRRHESSGWEPHLIRLSIMPDLSDFIFPTVLLFIVAFLWLLASMAEWLVTGLHLDKVHWTINFPVTLGLPAATFLWTLRARWAVQPLRGFLLLGTIGQIWQPLFSRIYVTTISISAAVASWSVIVRLWIARPSLSAVTNAVLPSISVIAIALVGAALIVTGLTIHFLFSAWRNQHDIRRVTQHHLGQQIPMQIGAWKLDADGKTTYHDKFKFEDCSPDHELMVHN